MQFDTYSIRLLTIDDLGPYIRNDLSNLHAQSQQLCDSVAQLHQRINESVKELQSQGISNEAAKAQIMQQHTDNINKMMATLSNILKKMSETSR